MNLVISLYCFVIISNHQINAVLRIRIARQTEKYTTKYDSLDIDRILQSKRLLKGYVNCLLDKGPCTQEGRLLKSYIPEALATRCAKCSETQRQQAGKVFSYLVLHHGDLWDKLLAKYDSDGNFRRQFGANRSSRITQN